MSPAREQAAAEESLQAFLRPLPPAIATRMRTLAHAWTAAGGQLQVGRLSVRLVATPPSGPAFTAATLHANHPNGGQPTLELCRVLLSNHGVAAPDWQAWSDEFADLQPHGFVASAKFPCVDVASLPDTTALRLGQGVRDLARLAQGQPA